MISYLCLTTQDGISETENSADEHCLMRIQLCSQVYPLQKSTSTLHLSSMVCDHMVIYVLCSVVGVGLSLQNGGS